MEKLLEIDRRLAPRIKTDPLLRISGDISAQLLNLSEGGVCFSTSSPISKKECNLTVELPSQAIKVTIQTKWNRQAKTTGQFLYGASMLNPDTAALASIKRFATEPCSRCILTRAVTGVTFNKDGLCNLCQNHSDKKGHEGKRAENIQALLKTDPKKHKYDCLCLYSGGKDSTYMLYNLVKKYNLRVLPFTLDNGYLSKNTFSNIDKVISQLGIDHIIYKPPESLVTNAFKTGVIGFAKTAKAKELSFLMGHVCWPCFVMIGIFGLKTAIEKNIPNMVIGTTPGQMRQKKYNLSATFNGIFDSYMSMTLPFIKILDKQYRKSLDLSLTEKIKSLKVKLVPFYEHFRYNEKEAEGAAERLFGWQRPADTDSCSSNCLINTLGIEIHKRRYAVHPYVIPLAHDVRNGLMSRQEALDAINTPLNDRLVLDVAEKLGLSFHYGG